MVGNGGLTKPAMHFGVESAREKMAVIQVEYNKSRLLKNESPLVT